MGLRSMGKKVLQDFEKSLKSGNVNAHPIYLMLDAESSPSKEKYDNAIRGCARLGLIHFEAYLCERAAEMFLEQNDSSCRNIIWLKPTYSVMIGEPRGRQI